MAGLVYILGTLIALACAVLLLRGYLRGRHKLLLWSSLCFFWAVHLQLPRVSRSGCVPHAS
jgi:hypothetical protein